MSVPSDQSYTNFATKEKLVVRRLTSAENVTGVTTTNVLVVPGGVTGDVLANTGSGVASWSGTLTQTNMDNGDQFQNIQQIVKRNNISSFATTNLYTQVLSGNPL